ncbi:hypothetical protein ACODT5_01485 [Streptomyces sp. 5.8]|uniref:hypothetical protein n=1 Tax=Streptomyces sp. 5.8 TaxID=3406571 RepID=UPI003BB75903
MVDLAAAAGFPGLRPQGDAMTCPPPDGTAPGARNPALRPYIASLASEQPEPARLTVRWDGSLGYADERDDDRDSEGGLWVRMPEHPDPGADGKVENWRPHPRRQRHLMRELLCQICAGPPARDASEAWLFVLRDGPESPSDQDDDWTKDLLEATPPVCLHGASISAERCPRLSSVVALWVRRPILHGIYGAVYGLGPHGIERRGRGIAEYEKPGLAWTVGTQMVRDLQGARIDWELTEELRSLHATAWSAPSPRRALGSPTCPVTDLDTAGSHGLTVTGGRS